MRKTANLAGKRYGMLTVVERVEDKWCEKGGYYVAQWRCVCDCGKEKIMPGSSMTSRLYSCGCTSRPTNSPVGAGPRIITIKDKLVVGRDYTFGRKKMRLVALCEHFARFRTPYGYTECFNYTDLQNWWTHD